MNDIHELRFAIGLYVKLADFCTVRSDERQQAMGLSYAEAEPAVIARGTIAFAASFARNSTGTFARTSPFADEEFQAFCLEQCGHFLDRKYVIRKVGDRPSLKAERADLAAELTRFMFETAYFWTTVGE